MEITKAKKEDVKEIMNIINQAKVYFKNNGIEQWSKEYPNENIFEEDIDNNCSYVLKNHGIILGTFCINIGQDKNYNEIYEGNWISDRLYGTIHRVAILEEEKGKGIFSKIVEFCEDYCIKNGAYSIRVDTHKNNKSMLKVIEKHKFKKCGIIYTEDGQRIAFEKIIR